MTVRRHQIRTIASSVERLTRPVFQRRGFAGTEIVEHWGHIVGPRLAEVCIPERITYPAQSRRSGILHLRIGSSSLALEIQHLEPQIVERINSHFGYSAIERLRIQHAPVVSPRAAPTAPTPSLNGNDQALLEASLDSLEEDELKEALRALGNGVMVRNASQKKS